MRKYPPKTPDEIVGNESEIEICDMAIHDLAIENRDLQTKLAAKEKEIERLKEQLISGFYADEKPVYTQGEPTHEFQELLTAEECNFMVNRIDRLLEGLKKYGQHLPGCKGFHYCTCGLSKLIGGKDDNNV